MKKDRGRMERMRRKVWRKGERGRKEGKEEVWEGAVVAAGGVRFGGRGKDEERRERERERKTRRE